MDLLLKLLSLIKDKLITRAKHVTPTVTVLILTVLVAGSNIMAFNGGKVYSDDSLAGKILAANPELNPLLYEKQQLAKAQKQNQASLAKADTPGNIFISAAQAQTVSLEDDDKADKKPFEYEVEGGDTLSGIAEKYNLKLNTILWANGLNGKSVIRPGQKITLLPVDGVLYTVKKGDTIGKVASLYKADSRKIMEYNDIKDSTKIHAGNAIIIPDGQPLPETKPKPTVPKLDDDSIAGNVPPSSGEVPVIGKLVRPTTAKNITQKYSASHRGIDIANGGKPPVYAAHGGNVEFAGTSGDWGKTILIRGDDGLVTRYSHNSENYVKTGDRVEAGDTIAKIGNTGRVRGRTGLHLDFRVYKNGVAVNPLNLLD